MRKSISFVLIILLLSVLITGCTTRIIDFTVISSKNCNIAGARGERVVGKDAAWLILFIPTGVPNLKEAVDTAIETGGGDCLVDGVVYSFMYYFVLGAYHGYKVEGTVVNTREVSETQ